MTSAGAKADQLKRRADELLKQAEAWNRGAQGEEATATLLTQLADTGWSVRNDLRLPGSRANVDHLLVGPSGIVVLDTKYYSGRVSVGKGLLWHNRTPMRRQVEAARRHSAMVAGALQLGPGTPVRTAMVIHGATLPADHFEFEELSVLAPARLVDWIRSLPNCWPSLRVAEVLAKVDAVIHPYVPADPHRFSTAARPPEATPVAAGPSGVPTEEVRLSQPPSSAGPQRTKAYRVTDVRDDMIGPGAGSSAAAPPLSSLGRLLRGFRR